MGRWRRWIDVKKNMEKCNKDWGKVSRKPDKFVF